MLLHRHASAGERLESARLDRLRPLDRAGRGDALRLTQALGDYTIGRVVSSPYRRCVETVAPFARARGLAVEEKAELAPHARLESMRELLDTLSEDSLVCTHREVFERLFGGAIACEKGGTWIVERRGPQLVPTAYVPPPTRFLEQRSRMLATGR